MFFIKTIPLILALLLIVGCNSPYLRNSIKENQAISSQSAPPDMVFIKGEDDMDSFYMGVTEEPNINYVIYLEWIRETFGRNYPEIVEAALPKSNEKGALYAFNDPAIESYMTHPAFSYYPIVGLTYEQIQNYLIWKSDRLNESILINTGYQYMDMEQHNESNFNTESYLVGQYQGIIRKFIKDKKTEDERSIMLSDGILMAGFRLPTEAEWERASEFPKALDKKRYSQPFSSQALDYPFGHNYFTFDWARRFKGIDPNGFFSSSRSIVYNSTNYFKYEIDNKISKKGFSYNLKNNEIINGYPNRLTNISDYDPNSYGVANMETGVKEILFDEWEGVFDSTTKNTFKIFEKNKATQGLLLDEKGSPVERDSLGRMHGIGNGKTARLMGKDKLCRPVFWSFNYDIFSSSNFTKPQNPTKRVVRSGTWKKPSMKQREFLEEGSYSNDVGFRVVLPYLGIPTAQKVKWK